MAHGETVQGLDFMGRFLICLFCESISLVASEATSDCTREVTAITPG